MGEGRLLEKRGGLIEDLRCSRTSLIRTAKGQSEVSVLERCPYKRGYYDDVTFMTAITVLSVQ